MFSSASHCRADVRVPGEWSATPKQYGPPAIRTRRRRFPQNGVTGNFAPKLADNTGGLNHVFGNYDPPQIKLAQKWCWLQWNAATGGIPEELLILPPGAIQSWPFNSKRSRL